MNDLKTAKATIPVHTASGKRVMVSRSGLALLREAGRVARFIRRRSDNAVTRAYLLAAPNEITKRITAQAEVVQVLPTTWTHRSSLAAGY